MCCGHSCCTCLQPTSWDGAILKGEHSFQDVFKTLHLSRKQTNRSVTYWIWVTEKLFQYVCDNEQMLSLFGCRVSNVLEFELRNMLKNFSDNFFLYNFLCTFFSWQYSLYKLLLQQASIYCITLGICSLFTVQTWWAFPFKGKPWVWAWISIHLI